VRTTHGLSHPLRREGAGKFSCLLRLTADRRDRDEACAGFYEKFGKVN